MYKIQQFVLFIHPEKASDLTFLLCQNLNLFQVGELPGKRARSCFGLVFIVISGMSS